MGDSEPNLEDFDVLSLMRISLVPREAKAPDVFPKPGLARLPRAPVADSETILVGLAAIPVQRA